VSVVIDYSVVCVCDLSHKDEVPEMLVVYLLSLTTASSVCVT